MAQRAEFACPPVDGPGVVVLVPVTRKAGAQKREGRCERDERDGARKQEKKPARDGCHIRGRSELVSIARAGIVGEGNRKEISHETLSSLSP